jgi:hypothetical protein
MALQDFESYSKRDYGRPARDPRTGSLPPKLAQILINLAEPNKILAVVAGIVQICPRLHSRRCQDLLAPKISKECFPSPSTEGDEK